MKNEKIDMSLEQRQQISSMLQLQGLSQSEIDKLLAQFASGEADAETMQKEESTKKIKT